MPRWGGVRPSAPPLRPQRRLGNVAIIVAGLVTAFIVRWGGPDLIVGLAILLTRLAPSSAVSSSHRDASKTEGVGRGPQREVPAIRATVG